MLGLEIFKVAYVLVAQLCLTVCVPMDCSSPDSSVHRSIFSLLHRIHKFSNRMEGSYSNSWYFIRMSNQVRLPSEISRKIKSYLLKALNKVRCHGIRYDVPSQHII